MGQQLFAFDVTVPAGTAKTAPQLTPMAFPPRVVEQIDILVPPGPRGRLGFAIAMAGVNVVPANNGGWIVSDDESIHWPVSDLPTSGAWQLLAYNTGIYPHTIEVRFLCRIPAGMAAGAEISLLPLSQLAPLAL